MRVKKSGMGIICTLLLSVAFCVMLLSDGYAKGYGPYADEWTPNELQQYWNPDLTPYRSTQKVKGTFKSEECIECHSKITPFIVKDFAKSAMGKEGVQNEEVAAAVKLEKIGCDSCHGNNHEKLRLPLPRDCGACHQKQLKETMSMKKYGPPDHITERNVVVPWYAMDGSKDVRAGQTGCDICHTIPYKCDSCHTRHRFDPAEARRPEACKTCHMGPDHPDWESYIDSKHGARYEAFHEDFDFKKKLNDMEPGDYPAPTCQTCHMKDLETGTYTHNVTSKGIWRMGTPDPKKLGINVENASLGPEARRKRQAWVGVCSDCHSPRFAELYLANLDAYMINAWDIQMRAQKIIEDLYNEGYLTQKLGKRDPFPHVEASVKAYGLKTIGKIGGFKSPDFVIGPILGVYGNFFQGENNPTRIERMYAEMWFWDKLRGYKGTAHAQPDYSYWWGYSPMLGKLGAIQSEANLLRRLGDMERLHRKRLKDVESGKIKLKRLDK